MPMNETFPDYLRPHYRSMPRLYMDSTIRFLRDPYRFISSTCDQLGTDVFETRIFLRKTYCFRGERAAELFYQPTHFKREAAAPEPVQATLLGKKHGVQHLDGAAHLKRKQMFMALLSKENVFQLAEYVQAHLTLEARLWSLKKKINLYEASQKILTQAVCHWMGIPLAEKDIPKRTSQLMAMFDKAGHKGLAHFWARRQREQAEKWIEELITGVRTRQIQLEKNALIKEIIFHKEDGEYLNAETLGNEILNVLRPVVATSVYINFVAHALELHPEMCAYVHQSPENLLNFVQEVRRSYPFFPTITAKTASTFNWQGLVIKKNVRAILDVYGTNHDPESWVSAHQFNPRRFETNPATLFNFIPQGGGDANIHHRCPGEQTALEIMKVFTVFLTSKMSYQLPKQNLNLDFARMPALPKSKIIMEKIKLLEC